MLKWKWYCDECVVDNADIMKHLLDRKALQSDINQIKPHKNQIHILHGLLVKKNKLKSMQRVTMS
jgi:hypothetical protein